MKKIQADKRYTSNGELVEILYTDGNVNDKRPYPVCATNSKKELLYFEEDGRCISYFREDGICITSSEYDLKEIFEPKEGQWCLFWDSKEQDGVILTRFRKMTHDGLYMAWDDLTWKYCKEFDGTLPEHLEKK
jgi:hypothetical protein